MIFSQTEYRVMQRRHRRNALGQAPLGQSAEMTGGIVAAEDSLHSPSIYRPVMIGVLTGVSVWLVTRLLDRTFKIERRSN